MLQNKDKVWVSNAWSNETWVFKNKTDLIYIENIVTLKTIILMKITLQTLLEMHFFNMSLLREIPGFVDH
jgi:hypothetical protein